MAAIVMLLTGVGQAALHIYNGDFEGHPIWVSTSSADLDNLVYADINTNGWWCGRNGHRWTTALSGDGYYQTPPDAGCRSLFIL